MPVVVEFILERVTNIAMGTEIDNISEFEEILDLPLDDTPASLDPAPGPNCCRPEAGQTRSTEREREGMSTMPKFAANLTMLFNEMPFLDRFARGQGGRVRGVEYLFPYDFEKDELRERLQRHGLTQVLHNLPAGNWAAGERGIAILPGPDDEFRDGVRGRSTTPPRWAASR